MMRFRDALSATLSAVLQAVMVMSCFGALANQLTSDRWGTALVVGGSLLLEYLTLPRAAPERHDAQ
jgi:hypothetical protein